MIFQGFSDDTLCLFSTRYTCYGPLILYLGVNVLFLRCFEAFTILEFSLDLLEILYGYGAVGLESGVHIFISLSKFCHPEYSEPSSLI